jgi:hypothetical protein
MGTCAAQSLLVLQATHTPWAVSQVGSGPVHCEELLAEHCVHSPLSGPLVWQAGVGAAQSLSPEHGWHAWVVPSQIGVVPEQFALVEH